MSSFIVSFKEDASERQIQEWKDKIVEQGGEIGQNYNKLFQGFSAKIQPQTLELLQSQTDLDDSPIELIEPDQTVTTK